jgi:hypothetical protein
MTKNTKTITKRIVGLAQNAPAYYPLIVEGAAGWILTGIDVFLRGVITLSGGAASGTQVGENPGGLIASIQLDASAIPGGLYRGGKVKNVTPRSVLRGNVFDMGRFQDDTGGNSVAGTAASTTLSLRLPLRFALPRLTNPIETGLRLDQFSQVLLTINMSSVAAMRTGNDRTVDLSAAYLEVVEKRTYAPNYYPLGTLFEDDRAIFISGANGRFSVDTQLPKSESYIDTLFMTESTANRTLVDTIMNRFTVFQASEQFQDRYDQNLRGENNDNRTEAATSLTGLYYFDFTSGESEQGTSGLLSNVVPFLNYILDVNNPGGANLDDLLVRTRRFAPRLGDPPKS